MKEEEGEVKERERVERISDEGGKKEEEGEEEM